MAKFSGAVLLLLLQIVSNIFVKGQSTISDYDRVEQDLVNVLSRFVKDLEIHNSDAWISLARSIHSVLQNLKAQISNLKDHHERQDTYLEASIGQIKGQIETSSNDLKTQISRLENRVERHDTYTNSSLQENKRQMQTVNVDTKAQLSRLENRVERHDSSISSALLENRRQMQEKAAETKNGIQSLTQKLSSGHCPTGFNYGVAGYSKCYAVLTDKVNWDTAQQKCRQLHSNAQLAVIINRREIQITTEILRNHDCPTVHTFSGGTSYAANEFWIGAQRATIKDCSSPFQWITNSGTTFFIQHSNWGPGEPSCSGKDEGCATINKRVSLKWNDLWCSWQACPLCEVTIHS